MLIVESGKPSVEEKPLKKLKIILTFKNAKYFLKEKLLKMKTVINDERSKIYEAKETENILVDSQRESKERQEEPQRLNKRLRVENDRHDEEESKRKKTKEGPPDLQEEITEGDSDKTSLTLNSEPTKTRTKKAYELRPRTVLRRPTCRRESFEDDFPAAAEVFCSRKSRSRGRTAQLSKYRRRTANARERHRMKEINAAFATLRQVLPQPARMKESCSLTKITTLRMAVDYIRALDELLHATDMKSYTQDREEGPHKGSFLNYESILLNLASTGSLEDASHSSSEQDLKGSVKRSYNDQFHDYPFEYEGSFDELEHDPGSNPEEDPIAILLSTEITESRF